METKYPLPLELVLAAPHRSKQDVKVIDDGNSVFRQQLSVSIRTWNIADRPSLNNERDDKGSFDDNDSGRQAPSPPASFQKKTKGAALSFDVTASTTVTDEGETSVDIGAATSRDSGSIPSFDSADFPLLKLENVTLISRSLISPELLSQLPPFLRRQQNRNKMATPAVTNDRGGNDQKQSRQGMFRKKIPSKRNTPQENHLQDDVAPPIGGQKRASTETDVLAPASSLNQANPESKTRSESSSPTRGAASNPQSKPSGNEEPAPRRGMLERIRSASRSRSRARSRTEVSGEPIKPILVAVTSCRSDAYYNQKAPGSTSKLPRKAPSNLKLFHELAVGIKDAYAAVGQTPTRPPEPEVGGAKQDTQLLEGKAVLWEFFGNLDFVSMAGFRRAISIIILTLLQRHSFWHL